MYASFRDSTVRILLDLPVRKSHRVLSRKRANSRVWDEKRCIILLPRRRRSLIGPCATLGCSSQELLEEMGSDVIL